MPLPNPIGAQREVVCLDHKGHTVVLGTAGSGKTTMAVHRAAYLSNPNTAHSGRALLLSFNNSLLAYLAYLRPPELNEVDIRTYHHFARGYLSGRDAMGAKSICQNPARIVAQALEQAQRQSPGNRFLRRPLRFFSTETRWMAQQGVTTLDEYLAIERIGRGDEGALGAKQRTSMFEIFDAYRTLRTEEGYQFDWHDIATGVASELAEDDSPRLYRHIIIDEGQDFSPVMLRSLAAAIPADGSLTFFGDVAQQVYGRRLSWRQAGLKISAPCRFERNYRNSPQIAKVGLAVSDMPYFAERADMVAPTEFAAEGPMPTLVRCNSAAEEIEFAIEQAQAAAESASVAVLVRRHEDEAPFIRAFAPNGQRLHKKMRHWSPDPGVSYGVVHNAKGYEFDTVILVGLNEARWPDPGAIEGEGEVDAETSDGRLLYVGVTRARSALIVTHTGNKTALLPDSQGLWTEVDARPLSANS